MNVWQEILSWIFFILIVAILLRKRGFRFNKKDKVIDAKYKIEKEEELEWR